MRTTVFMRLTAPLILAGMFSAPAPALAQDRPAARSDCNQPAAQAVTVVDVPGRPFAAVPSADGCHLFVSLTAAKGGRSQIAVLARANGVLSLARTVNVPGKLTGLTLSRDGTLLIAANDQGAAVLSTGRLLSGESGAVLGAVSDGSGAGSIYVAFGPEDRLLFIANERSNSLSVYDFAGMRAGQPAQQIGQIPTAGAPVGLAFSPDGRWLYSTSEVAAGERSCAAEGRGGMHPPGVLMVVDVARSATDPEHAVVARVPAGCNPVRVAASASGDRVYVTARGSNAVQVFDAAKLPGDPAHAWLASVAVGQSPVGLALNAERVFVANSDRFGGGRHQSISVLDVAHLDAPGASIPAGGFPRELRVTSDGGSLIVTNFESGSVELIDLARLPEVKGGAGK